MAAITRNSNADVSYDASMAQLSRILSGDYEAGEDIDPGAPCCIRSDGKVYMSDATANNANARVHGFSLRDYLTGETVTLLGPGVQFRYGTGMTPGDPVFVSTTPGALDTAAQVGSPNPVGWSPTATDVIFDALKLD